MDPYGLSTVEARGHYTATFDIPKRPSQPPGAPRLIGKTDHRRDTSQPQVTAAFGLGLQPGDGLR